MLNFITPDPDLGLDWWVSHAVHECQQRCQFRHVSYLVCDESQTSWFSDANCLNLILNAFLKRINKNFPCKIIRLNICCLWINTEKPSMDVNEQFQQRSRESLDGYVSCKKGPALALRTPGWPSRHGQPEEGVNPSSCSMGLNRHSSASSSSTKPASFSIRATCWSVTSQGGNT